MLKQLDDFREILDTVLCKCIRKRTICFGHGRTGRFIEWYAKYYHNIEMDYIITLTDNSEVGWNEGLFWPTLIDLRYKDVEDAVILVTVPLDEDIRKRFEQTGYIENISYFDLYELMYHGDNSWPIAGIIDPYKKRKEGMRDIQFAEWLEYKYDCNFVERVLNRDHDNLHYCLTSQPEIFPILDQCHISLNTDEGIFDFGMGKGGAITAFRDYGFKKIGGVEIDKQLFNIAKDNLNKLSINSSMYCNDASMLTYELDEFSYFYFFDPFRGATKEKCINNILDSYDRVQRKITLILLIPFGWEYIEQIGRFRLKSQLQINTTQRIVNIYELKQ